jgi:hypothetical protein
MLITNDFQGRLRIATLLTAVVLGWFSLATIFASAVTPAARQLTLDATSRPDPAQGGVWADWSAAVAPLRGDLLADVAVARAIPVLKPGKAPASPDIIATREEALASAAQSLAYSPHASRTWLLVAMLQSAGPLRTEALKMSYLTSPADPSLIPTRLAVLAMSAASSDSDLANFARGDIRLILTRRPELKTAISSAYEKGSAEGRTYIYDVARSLDAGFAATLQ